MGMGGAEKFVIDLCNELSKKHEVIIYSLFNVTDSMLFVDNISNNIKVVTFNKKLGLDFSIFFKLIKSLNTDKPDIVNTHLQGLFYSSLSVMFLKTKYFHTVHNVATKEVNVVYRFIHKILFRFLSVNPISISNEVLKSVQYVYGDIFRTLINNGSKKLSTTSLLNFVKEEIDSYKNSKDTVVFTSIGRITTVKNHLLLLNTINKLSASGRDVLLLIIGKDTSPDQKVKKSLMQQSLPNVRFLGLKSNISDYLKYSNAFCLSSLYEGLPISLLEALSLGVIPICTPAGGIVDVIDDGVGFLSDGFGVDDYSNAFNEFLNLTDFERSQMQNNCIKLFEENYSISICADNYITTYEKERHV